jgi:hypothetical protein
MVVAGASAGALLVMVAAMAGPEPATPTGAVAQPVVVVRRSGGSPPAVARTDAAPVTTTAAS